MSNANYSKDSFSKKKFIRKIPTLYRNQEELNKALSIVKGALSDSDMLYKDLEGFVQISDVVELLKKTFEYVNSTHVIELFFKDNEGKILINGDDRIKYKVVKFVKPPKKLYFGTLENMRSRMLEHGLKSNTKGYIKLYDTEDRAILFASKFATKDGDKIITLSVDAETAFSDGLKFSTYIDGEYIVVKVDKKYLGCLS